MECRGIAQSNALSDDGLPLSITETLMSGPVPQPQSGPLADIPHPVSRTWSSLTSAKGGPAPTTSNPAPFPPFPPVRPTGLSQPKKTKKRIDPA